MFIGLMRVNGLPSNIHGYIIHVQILMVLWLVNLNVPAVEVIGPIKYHIVPQVNNNISL